MVLSNESLTFHVCQFIALLVYNRRLSMILLLCHRLCVLSHAILLRLLKLHDHGTNGLVRGSTLIVILLRALTASQAHHTVVSNLVEVTNNSFTYFIVFFNQVTIFLLFAFMA